jgi:hypothetical protein
MIDENKIWETIGEHKSKLTTLEASQYQMQQSILNVRAELNGNFQRHEDRVEKWLHEVKDDILAPLLERVGRMEKFMYAVVGGATVIFGVVQFLPAIRETLSIIGN